MVVPAVTADSTSSSPAKVPPTIFTVAPVRPRLSTSVTERADEIVVLVPSVNDTLVAAATVGASLIGVIAIVLVVLLVSLGPPLSSTTVQVTVRAGSEPKSVGFSL